MTRSEQLGGPAWSELVAQCQPRVLSGQLGERTKAMDFKETGGSGTLWGECELLRLTERATNPLPWLGFGSLLF